MPVPPVPHRPARQRPRLPIERALELAPAPAPPPAGPGWLSGLLPATSMLPVVALGATGHAHGTALLLALLVIPAVGGTVAMHVTQRRRARRDSRHARDRWSAHLAGRVSEAASAAAEQRLALDRLHPVDLLAAVGGGCAFERRPTDDDALVVVIGAGEVPARRPLVRTRAGPLDEVAADLDAAAEAAVAGATSLAGAPVCVGLRAARVLAVVGTEAETTPVLTRVLGELAALHAPGELALGGRGLPWAASLPHGRGGPGFDADRGELAGWLAGSADTPMRVAVLSTYGPGDDPALDAALAGVETVAVVGVRQPADVPACAGAVLDVASRILRVGSETRRLELVERLDPAAASQLSAAIAARAPASTSTTPTLAELLTQPRVRELTVPIGLDLGGAPVELGLAEAAAGGDGPHGLLVGATGSGKSVLLRTIVAGLVARHSPDELTLLLVDYKGGAAFADLAELPHVGGLVTNLDEEPGLLRRVSLALGAELDRRQRLLRSAGAESRRSYDGRLPTLLVAVDEAGELLAADPELADVFARIGRLGRSLGVHLLFATQHWDAGRLHTLDAHLRYRLCLRTFTAEDSRAVLGNDAALRLPARSGAAWVAVDGKQRRVDVLPPPADPRALVRPCASSADPVWLPPLPANLPWPGDGSLGRLDRPERRAQPRLRLDLDGPGGHVAVAGGPRSGVTTTLRAIVYAACATQGPADLHVHVLDLAGGLSDLGDLPQVGTVAALHEAGLVRAVVSAVRGELTHRAADGVCGPRVLLVVDGAGLLRSDDGLLEEALADIGARGLAHDVHLVLGVRRWSELRGGLLDAAGTRLELRLGDPSESLAGRAAAARVPRETPGRGLLPDGTLLQVAFPDASALPARAGRVAPVVLLPTRVSQPVVDGDGAFLIGLGGPAATPVGLDVLAPGRHLVIAGDAGSGRTTVLRRLVRHLAAGRGQVEVHVLDPRRTLIDVADLATTWSHAAETAADVLDAVVATLRRRLPDPRAGPAELDRRTLPAGPVQVVVLDDVDLLDGGPLGVGPLAPAMTALAGLLPYAPEVGLHVVLVRPAAARGLDPLAQRLRASAPWTLALPGEHLAGPAAGRGAPTLVGRGLLVHGSGPALAVQCFLDATMLADTQPQRPA